MEARDLIGGPARRRGTIHALRRALRRVPRFVIGAVFLVPATLAQCELGSISFPQAAVPSGLGSSVAVSGEWMLVGARSVTVGGFQSAGVAHVFRDQGGGWTYVETLEPPVPQAFGDFGARVAIDGGRALVTEPGEPSFFVQGRAHAYELQGSIWSLVQTIDTTVSGFGEDMDLDGDRVLFGARFATMGSFVTQSGYVYEHDGSSWSLAATIGPPVLLGGFGFAVALDGDRALIGAPLSEGCGTAYLFEEDASGWGLVQTFDSPCLFDDADLFGDAVALAGGRAVIGAPQSLSGAPGTGGRAYVYEEGPSGWSSATELQLADTSGVEVYGFAVETESDRAIVSGRTDVGGGTLAGAVHLFEPDGLGGWSQTAVLRASDATALDGFGGSIWMGPDLVAIGATGAVVAGSKPGAVYLVDPDSALCGTPDSISLLAGGTHRFDLNAGLAHAGEVYWILGTTTGTMPGQPAPPFTLPLNSSPYFLFTALNPNTLIQGSLALLDGVGRATGAELPLPPGLDPALAGAMLDHAGLLLSVAPLAASGTTNAVTLRLLP